MDIKVTAKVGVLAAIGNACKRPFDGLLIMKMVAFENNLGKSGKRGWDWP